MLRLSGVFTDRALSTEEIQCIQGEPDRAPGSAPSDTLMLVSWNIAYGRRCERHADVLAALAPDVCLLQEVDLGCRRSGFRDVAQWLAGALDMNWVFAGEFQEIGQGRVRGDAGALTGQAILSRYAISAPAVIVFPDQAWLRWHANPWQPRRGARMALRAETAGLRVYNTHIESGKNDAFRRRQLAHIAAAEKAIATPCMPVVIAGDLNCGRTAYLRMMDMLHDHRFVDALNGDPGRRRTSISRTHALDWIFVRRLTVVGAGVGPRHSGSDHFPVWAKVERPALHRIG